VSVSDARTLTVSPWDKNMVSVIEKAIRESDLGLNPATAGQVIRVPMPALTEERRKDLGKLVRTEGENAKIAIRNVRRDCNQHIKELLKKKEISQGDDKRAEEVIQKFTDKFIVEVDKLVTAKEQEVIQV
jgi:ribosome recycling factor